jgi:hypothetical protein
MAQWPSNERGDCGAAELCWRIEWLERAVEDGDFAALNRSAFAYTERGNSTEATDLVEATQERLASVWNSSHVASAPAAAVMSFRAALGLQQHHIFTVTACALATRHSVR